VSCMDCVLHFVGIGWKVFFATIPPPHKAGGWACFGVALAYIGIVTAIVGEVAGLFGCILGLKASVTAITFVALGTSLPDTFASKAAAIEGMYADAAIGNVTGSNSVNVFLGLGLPWVIAAHWYEAVGKAGNGGEPYKVPAGDLAFSVGLFLGVSITTLLTLVIRRKVVGGELGGLNACGRNASAVWLISLWMIYVLFSSLKSYNRI
jgi:Ca2+/Na+ antiporter